MTALPESSAPRYAMKFIDLERRFHVLAETELGDVEALVSLSEDGFGSDVGWPELLEDTRVILLAEAGAGKTVEMREQAKQLVKDDRFAFFVALESLDHEPVGDCLSPDEARRFNAWKEDREALAWFFLDAVDELKLAQGKLDRALRRLSRDIDGRRHRARIILSCRPSDWRPELDLATVRSRLPAPERAGDIPFPSPGEVFMSALRREHVKTNSVAHGQEDRSDREAVRTVVMLPMSRRQIELFANQSGVSDAAAFLEEITRQDAWIFAGRPLDLADLIGIWTSSGRLGTRTCQHEANAESKLRDDPDRPDSGVLSDVRARLGAERLALALALTRTRTIRSPEQALDIHRADGVLAPASILPDWTEAERQALLRRALFDPATYGRVRFHHRSIQEYLAARHLRKLRDQGMSTKALFRLLFAEHYGVEVVLPSMRAITAWLSLWDDAVREELTKREPETLLSLGDPETLTLAARGQLVRAFSAAYREGSRHGLNIPIAEVRRLSHPALAPVIRECWGDGPASVDVRDLLVEMIWQGSVVDCADLAHTVAFGPDETPDRRIVAIRALIACGCRESAREVADAMLVQPGSWPDRVVYGVAADLFPTIITVDELITLIERTPEPKHTVGGFAWASREIAETIEPWLEPAVALRDKMADLLRRGGRYEDGCFGREFGYLATALAILCGRQLSMNVQEGSYTDLIHASIIVSRFGKEGWRKSMDSLRKRFHENEALRSEAFWAELAFMDEIHPVDDDWDRLHRSMRYGITGYLTDTDRPWLEAALADESQPRRRVVALHALIEGWRGRGRLVPELEAIRSRLKGDMNLGRILDECTAPPGRDMEIERRRQHEKYAEARHESQRLAQWKKWRDELLADPESAFTTEKLKETISRLYTWLQEHGQDSSGYDVWDKNALAHAFNPDIAERAEKAFRVFWRTRQPVLWSALSNEERNIILPDWVQGLAGVSAESRTPGWATSLSPEDARTAAAYATIELNGFAQFITDLTASHPEEVVKLIGGEVDAELMVGDEHDYLPILHDLAYTDSNLKRLLVPRLLPALKSWRNTFTDETGMRWANHLHEMLRILGEADNEADREVITQECTTRYRADPAGVLAPGWLRCLFRFDAVQGAQVLIAGLTDRDDPDTCEYAIGTFAALFGGDEAVSFDAVNPEQRACLLGQLVRYAYAFVRQEDDQRHNGVYSPNTRDNAQHARDFLLSSLLETPGPETHRVVLALADEPDFASLRDYLRLCARRRAAADAEFDSFAPEAVIDLEDRYEIPPNDKDSLFVVMMDRLEDLAHELAHDDFSDRRLVRSITEEREMQRTLARRLREKANGAYTVMREEEVADGRHPDIRLSAVGVDRKVVMEVKIADNWSLTKLGHALRNQLVGRYLRHSNCKGGCLLLTYHGGKQHWIHPVTSARRLTFPETVQFLKGAARSVEQEYSYGIRVAVFGLDLTDPPPEPARRVGALGRRGSQPS